jgi:predicted dinucleotide-binding enzyme
MVGQAIGSKLIQLGHEVKMGSRTADNETRRRRNNHQRRHRGKNAVAHGG